MNHISFEERLNLVARQAKSLILITLTPTGTVVDWSAGAQAMFGWAAPEIVGKPIAAIFSKEDVADGIPAKELEQAKVNGAAPDTRWLVRKDGSKVFVDGEVTALRLPDGTFIGFVKTLRDATAILHFQQSDATLRAIINATPHMVWSADSEGRGDYFNERMLEFTGLPIESLVGHGWTSAVHPDDRSAVRYAWENAKRAWTRLSVDMRFLHHSGEYRWVLCRGEPVFDQASGELVRWMGTNTDIHEQKVSNEALRDARHRLDAALSAGNIGTWNWDPTANVLYADEHMRRLFGIKAEEENGVSPKLFFAAIHPSDVGFVRASVKEALATGGTFSATFRIFLPSGAIRHVHARGKVEFADNGTPLCMPGGVIDVTELRTSQEELRVREERYRTLLNSIDEGVAIVEADLDAQGRSLGHRVMETNPAMSAITGMSSFCGRSFADVVQDSPFDWNEVLTQVLHTGETVQHTAEIEQGQRWIDISVSRIGGGGATQAAILLRDITERTRREAELRLRDERYRALFDSMAEGFAVIELEFDEAGQPVDYRFLEVNPALKRLTGLRNVTGKTLREVVDKPNLDWVGQYAEALRTGEPVRITDYSSALGAWFDISVVRLGGVGSRQLALLFDDVTDRRKNDEALRQLAADLAQANLRQHEFLATLAHELRNPLAPIRASLDVMRMAPAGSATTTRARDIMVRQVDHLVHLVDDLLDLARVTSGKIELKKAPVQLDDILALAIEATAPMINEKHHRFVREIKKTPLCIDADKNRMVQVVSNLLTNAVKYTPDHGIISLSAGRDGDNAVIKVADNGIGIPASAQPYLFDMFSQVHTGSELAHGGLGIGLNLVKRLMEKHGGSIHVCSAGEGKGSEFTLRLPLIECPAGQITQNTSAVPDAACCQRALRILVVDDNVDAADMLGQVLQVDGHEVDLAYDAQNALVKAKQINPDLAVLDIGMHGMDGLDLARAIRSDAGLAHIKLIAVTGWGTEQDRENTRKAGFDAHLTKPVEIDALRARIAELCTRP
nr:PAS domain S-box protein [Telluria antibiotica]